MGVPSPVAVRLRIMAFAVAGRTAVFLTIADPFFSVAAQQSGQECRHRQETEGLDQSNLSEQNDPGTADDRAGK